MKYMLHARRQKMTLEDVNMALAARNLEPMYGYDPTESLNYRLVPNSTLFYVPAEEIDLETFLQEPLPKAPQPMTLTSHWLAIEGVQPAIPENPTVPDRNVLGEPLVVPGSQPVPPGAAAAALKASTEDIEVKGPVRHVLSRELQLYYDMIISDLNGGDLHKVEAALLSVEQDAGIQNLLPYFIQFVADGVPRNLRSLDRLLILMRLLRSLLINKALFVEPYLHQLMPPILTCLLGKRLCEDPEREPHWSLRRDAAELVAYVCGTFGQAYQTIIPRVTKTMAKTLADGEKPLTSHYGAVVGLTALGPLTVESVILPILHDYLGALTQGATNPDALSPEARQVWNVLFDACKSWLQFIEKDGLNMLSPQQQEYRNYILQTFGPDISAHMQES
jgi:transcription initiation factor TFIID subunit 6